MTHIDEHILELYVLGAEEVTSQKESIRAHLSVCAGCREMADRMRNFYATAAEDPRVDEVSPSSALRKRGKPRVPVVEPFHSMTVQQRPSWVVRSFRFVRTHPRSTAMASVTVVALLALSWNERFLGGHHGNNPVDCREDFESGIVEIRGTESEPLWSLSVPELGDYRKTIQDGLKPVQFADLDHDGQNEVVTHFARIGGYETASNRVLVFRADRSLFSDIRVGDVLTYKGRLYPSDYHIDGCVIGDFARNGEQEIVVLANHNHSPSIVQRLSPDGRILGEYRHFGHLHYLTRIETAGRPYLLAFGHNDRDESTHPLAVIVVLDPTRLTGNGEASHTRGFGSAASEAEVYYINIPQSELSVRAGREIVLRYPRIVGLGLNQGFRVNAYGSVSEALPVFEYNFGDELQVLEVKSSNGTRLMFDQYGPASDLPGPFYDEYLKHLARSVRYWSGSSWTTGPIPVQH